MVPLPDGYFLDGRVCALWRLGTSVGWALFQIFMIMTATVSGVLTGEWKHAPLLATVLMGVGLVSLTCATVLLALGNR